MSLVALSIPHADVHRMVATSGRPPLLRLSGTRLWAIIAELRYRSTGSHHPRLELARADLSRDAFAPRLPPNCHQTVHDTREDRKQDQYACLYQIVRDQHDLAGHGYKAIRRDYTSFPWM